MQRPVDDLLAHLNEVTEEVIDRSLLGLALTHRSYAYENGAIPHNERLEFLGDSVLSVVVTDSLYRAYPDESEGHLAKVRAAVVNMRALADVGRTLGIGDFMLLGRGEETTGGRDKSSILADTTEAIIGAVYLSVGLAAAARLIHHLLDPLVNAAAALGAGLDWKTSVQEASVARDLGGVEYRIVGEGPEHDKLFTASAVIAGNALGHGVGRTKKDAEQSAAEEAWHVLQAIPLRTGVDSV